MLGCVRNVSFTCSTCSKGKHVLGSLFHLAVGNEYFGDMVLDPMIGHTLTFHHYSTFTNENVVMVMNVA